MVDVPVKDGEVRPQAWQRRKAFRRVEILDAAVQLLEEVGHDRMSMAEIASRASVSEATVYKYFESKTDLLDYVILASLGPTIEYLEREIPLIPGSELKLRFFVVRSMLDMVDKPMMSRAIYGELRWRRRNDTLKGLHRRLSNVVTNIFVAGIEDGEIDPGTDTTLAGDMLFGGLASAGWRTLLAQRELPGGIEGFATRFARQMIGGISLQATSPAALYSRLEDIVARMEKATD